MLVTVEGIVIGKRSFGDSSCYLDILTNEFGVIEVMARGVKKINSGNLQGTALFSYSVFCVNKKQQNYALNSLISKYSFHKLSEDIFTFSLAAYFAEIIKYTSAAEQFSSGNSELRLLAITFYELINKKIPLAFIKSTFELRLCSILGLRPDLIACSECCCYEHDSFYFTLEDGLIYCGDCYDDITVLHGKNVFRLSPEFIHTMRYIVFSPLDKIYKIKPHNEILNEMSIISEKYFLYHIGRNFKTLDYFKKL